MTTNGVGSSNSATDWDASSPTPAPAEVASKDTFLRLLVAQLQAQNPLNPKDGAEFVAQLATFTQVEQMLGMRQDIQAIREQVVPAENSELTAQ